MRRMVQRFVVIVAMVSALSLGGTALAQEGGGGGAGAGAGTGAGGGGAGAGGGRTCTLYGCTPTLGNPIQELGGMIVTCGAIAIVLGGVARRFVA